MLVIIKRCWLLQFQKFISLIPRALNHPMKMLFVLAAAAQMFTLRFIVFLCTRIESILEVSAIGFGFDLNWKPFTRLEITLMR